MEDFRNVQRAANVRSKPQLIVIRLRQGYSIQRVRPCIQHRRIVIKIHVAVGLIYIETAAHAAERDRPTTTSRSAAKSTTTSGATESKLLRTFAKFLNAILEITFVACAKVLRASLHAADAHRFRRRIRSGAIQREARKIARARALTAACRNAGIPGGEGCVAGVHRQTLETAHGTRGSGAALAVLNLPRCEN